LKESLKKLGIVGPRHYRHLVDQLGKAQARAAKLAHELDAARTDARTCRTKVDELTKTLRKHQSDAEYQLRRAEKLTSEIDRIRRVSSQKVEQRQREIDEAAAKRAAAFEELQRRLAAAEHELMIAREALMAVDVKLDILEGAANVLDLRTRHASVDRDTATERAV
jgi:predicted  nucleic acid-binding Zn-ribbon protein